MPNTKSGDGKSRWHGRRQAYETRSSPNDKTDDDAVEQHGRSDEDTEAEAPRRHGRRQQGGEAVERLEARGLVFRSDRPVQNSFFMGEGSAVLIYLTSISGQLT
ncbi:hypothetical protein PIB30_047567 [Stylosanthes scabra]|uniref:Uncharacterized protein n=1 Tax=Stylosanthes scabra TaxID=79078 RepID=A0ABU6VGU1_9FABA|nr:hypothetical protein [Stylosanthes scabra]